VNHTTTNNGSRKPVVTSAVYWTMKCLTPARAVSIQVTTDDERSYVELLSRLWGENASRSKRLRVVRRCLLCVRSLWS
jgi:hypothetical protein